MHGMRSTVAAVVLALVAGACGSTGPTPAPAGSSGQAPSGSSPAPSSAAASAASQAPTASPAPTARPSARLDASLAFVGVVTDPTFSTSVAITGTSQVGASTTTTRGTLDISGRTSHLVLTHTTGAKPSTLETITGNGSRYVSSYGLWFAPGEARDDDLPSMLRTARAVTDSGVEQKNGEALHHLVIYAPATLPFELGLAAKGIDNVDASIDAWVRDDGTPVVMEVTATWDQQVGARTVRGSKAWSLEFSGVGEPVTVVLPTDTWTMWSSRRYGYRMAHPSDWEVSPGTSKYADGFVGPSDDVFASRARRNGASLATINKQILTQIRQITGYKGVKVDSNKPARLGGVPARRVEFHGTDSGDKVWAIAVFAVRGSWWYYVEYDTYDQVGAGDRDLFDQFLGSFTFK